MTIPPAAGERVGAWELERRIGAGGMGEVWIATRRQGGFAQRGALKRLHEAAKSDELIARFQRERQILASIEDPSIARLIDGGLDDDGRPFLVMEYVEGEPIDAWCRARRTPLLDRIALLARVARAVDTAHSHRIVHRDLKPSNVLVDLEGRPRLIDFGVAKVLDPDRDTTLVTRDVARYLTPQFASPEQFAGRPPSTASDVYSLGALAYQLLTGSAPLDLSSVAAAEAVQRVAQESPRAPSAVAARPENEAFAAACRTTRPEIRKTLAGDLDAVLLRCLRKEPARRYGRAGELADDLERWTRGRPVLARRDSMGYRASRFVRRHRPTVALTAFVFLAMLTSLGVTLVQRQHLTQQSLELSRRAERSERLADDLRASVRSLTISVYPELAVVPGTQPVLANITRELGELAERQDDPRMVAEAVRANFLYSANAWEPFMATTSHPEEVARSTHAAREVALELVSRPEVSVRAYHLASESFTRSAWYRYYEGDLTGLLRDAEADEAWMRERMFLSPEELVGKGRAEAIGDRFNPLERIALAWINLRIAYANGLVALGRLQEALHVHEESLAVALELRFTTTVNQAILENDYERLSGGIRSLRVRLGLPLDEKGERKQQASHDASWSALANHRIGSTWSSADALVRKGRADEAANTVIAQLERLGDPVDSEGPLDEPSQERAWIRFKLAEIELERGHEQESLRHASVAFHELQRCVAGRPTAWVEDYKINTVRRFYGRAMAIAGDSVEGARLIGVALDQAARRLARAPHDWPARLNAIDACCDLAGLQLEAAERQAWLDRAEEYLEGGETDAPDSLDLRERRSRIDLSR